MGRSTYSRTGLGHLEPSKWLAVTLLISILTSSAVAQQLLVFGTGALPTCAEQCTLLSQAQAACVPPAAPATAQATYLSCFCQSSYLTSLSTNAAPICGTVCGSTDLSQIQQWYTNTCTTVTNNAAGIVTTSTSATTTSAAATATASSAVTPAATLDSSQTQSWWASHWRWVLMLILIAVLLGLLAFAGVMLRRRHRRKRDRTSGRFNDGITARAMTSTPGITGLFPSPYSGDHSRRRQAPIDGTPESDSRLASSVNVARARGKDGEIMRPASAMGASTDDVRRPRGLTPQPAGESDTFKGKGRARISEEAVQA